MFVTTTATGKPAEQTQEPNMERTILQKNMDNSEYIMQTLYDSRLVNDLMSGWQKARKRIPEKLSRFEMYLAGSAIAKTI